MASQSFDVGEVGHRVNADRRAEGVLDESLQAYLVERVEGKVGLDVVGGMNGNAFFRLDEVLD